jgi:UDPglucose 6-dehydrogenase
MERSRAVLPPTESLRYASGIYDAAQDADAVLILTDWKEFAGIDLERLHRVVRFPIVIDGRNLYKPQRMADYGFQYVSVGRPACAPETMVVCCEEPAMALYPGSSQVADFASLYSLSN